MCQFGARLGLIDRRGAERSAAPLAGIWAPEKTDCGDCWSDLEQVLQLLKRKRALFFQRRTIKAPSVQGNGTEGILVALCPINTQSWIPLRNNPAHLACWRVVPRAALNPRQGFKPLLPGARAVGPGQGQRPSSSTLSTSLNLSLLSFLISKVGIGLVFVLDKLTCLKYSDSQYKVLNKCSVIINIHKSFP